MKTSTSKPTITSKWHIEVPTHQYESLPSVFKVWFGKKYLIWKGKSLLQSCQYLAEGVERFIRLGKTDDTDYLYHVCKHVTRTRCIKATVEVIDNSFIKRKGDGESINGYGMLVMEQRLLDKAKNDADCLNNNAIAYIPNWIKNDHVLKFQELIKSREKV